MTKEEIFASAEELFSDKYASIYYLKFEQTLICEAKAGYIPIEEFKRVFEEAGKIIKTHTIRKLIFDKRSLTTFHQGSMEWYHVVWKPKMLVYGLKTYRKLLPNDIFFQKSVEIGKTTITRNNPDFNSNDFDIQYCNSIAEALEK